MSVFNEFCQAWRLKFPGETLPGVWEEDLRANLIKHKQKLQALKLDVEKEEFYVKFLENVLTDVENSKQRNPSQSESSSESTARVSNSRTSDSTSEAHKPDFVTVISITSKLEEDGKHLEKGIDRPRAPPKPPPKQYNRSFSGDHSETQAREDIVAWTKKQIQDLHSKQLTKQERQSPPTPPIPPLPQSLQSSSASSVNSEHSEKNGVTHKPQRHRSNYENVNTRKLDYENVFDSFPSRERRNSENGGKQSNVLPVTDMDSEVGRVKRATSYFQQQQANSSPPAVSPHPPPVPPLPNHTSADDPFYDSVPREEMESDRDYVYMLEQLEDEKDFEVEREGTGTLKSVSSTDNSSTGSLTRLYANLTSLDDFEPPKSSTPRQVAVLKNFLESEESYLDALNLAVQYNKALAANLNSSQPVISQEEICCIFSNIQVLYRHHKEFLEVLRMAEASDWNMLQVAQAFRNLSEAVLPEYATFLNNYKDALEATRKAAQNSTQFAQLTRRMKLRSKDPQQQQQQTTTLEDLLHKPVARVQRHVAIIKDLVDCVSQDDPSHSLLSDAQQLTRTFLSEFSTHQLQSLFPSQSSKHHCSHQTNRVLVKNGFLVELQSDGKRKQRHCFLFTDLIVCSKYKSTSGSSGNLEVKWYLTLAHVSAMIDDSAVRLNVSALTNVASLRSQAAAVRTQMERSVAGSDKQRKKLALLEAKLLLDSPNLPLKFIHKPKGSNSKTGQQYTFLLSSEYERTLWLEAVEALKRNTSQRVVSVPQWEEVENLVKQCRTAVEPPAGSTKNTSAVAIGGELQVVIHSLRGLQKPSDVYVVIELDSYGHFFHQARTKMVIQSTEPQWEEDFHIELEGSKGMRILLYEEDSKQIAALKGKAELELTLSWLKGLKGPQTIPLTVQSSRTPISRHGASEELQLCMTLRYLSYDYTMRRPAQRCATTGIFGVPIEEVCLREKRPIPYIVSCCVREVERRGLDEVGIYRVSGLATDISKLRKAFDTRGSESDSLLRDVDINSVSGLLKLYLRQLPEALFTDKLYPHFLQAFSTLDHAASMNGVEDTTVEGGAKTLIQLFSSLPKVNKNVIFYILEHLVRVHNNLVQNKMSLHNLATVFGPTLLRPATQSATSDNGDQATSLALGTVDVMAQAGILHFFLLRKARGVPIMFPPSELSSR